MPWTAIILWAATWFGTPTEGSPWVGPPDVIEACEARLQAAEVRFSSAQIEVHWNRGHAFQCGTPQAVRYISGPAKIRWQRSPKTSCALALALAKFEVVVREEALRHLKTSVVAVRHAGTYNCREMAAYPGWVSEHSYANAIDISGFRLHNRQELTVGRDYNLPGPRGAFLRAVARRAFDEGIFSVVLTPAFDGLHRHHLHVDLARYRVDGTGR